MNILKQYKLNDGFLLRYQNLVCNEVIPYQKKILDDKIEGVEKSHAMENYRQAAQLLEKGKCDGEFYGMVFQDSDVAKWLEAASYSLSIKYDPELEKEIDSVIELVGRAQMSDGYLNTYFTVKEPGRQWTDLQEAHELYCAGHMIEAGVAYYESCGKDSLLKIVMKLADCIYNHFITEKAPGYPGHPEIEEALMRLYGATGEKRYMELALHFINVRGEDSDFFMKESQSRGWSVWGSWNGDKEYTLCHKPVREQMDAVGHAVRAVYLYTGMADAAYASKDKSLEEACLNLWKSIVNKRMYITGSIGSAYEGEAFTKDYHLPNDSTYGETCASVGLIFFANQMLRLQKKSEFGDVMERVLYNGLLSGMELDGKKFYYTNPLECIPGITGKAVNLRHVLEQRPAWFPCACCPPNVARLLTSIGKYIYSVEDENGCGKVWVNLFADGELNLSQYKRKIICKTKYPYGGSVNFTVTSEEGEKYLSDKFTLAIRIPSWSKKTRIYRNGKILSDHYLNIKDGYAYFTDFFLAKENIRLEFDMSVKKIYANPKVYSDNGKVAFTRGPLVYCAEGFDNDGDLLSVRIRKNPHAKVLGYNPDELSGVQKISVRAKRIKSDDNNECLYSDKKAAYEKINLILIPYYAWNNRGVNQMRVWLPQE